MLADLRAAFGLLTILPVGYSDQRPPGYSFSWFPIVGLVIGGLLALIGMWSFPTPEIRGFVLLVTWVVVTGGLHLDGFGDSCDGLLATTTPERRLAIMGDPRTGVWAVLGLVLLLLGKWVFLQTIAAPLLLVPPVVARWAMVLPAAAFPHAHTTGLGSYFRVGLGRRQVLIATLLVSAITLVVGWLVDWRVLFLVLLPVITVAGFGRWASRRLGGGLTGDSYGAIGELTELCGLVVLSLWVNG
jgi:adenosylcobinamide-GDP ribazoletransferase